MSTEMVTAKLFQNGGSQAIRIPKSYRFEGDLVYVKPTPMGLLVIPPSGNFWENWLTNLREHTWDVEDIDDVTNPSERPWGEVFT